MIDYQSHQQSFIPYFIEAVIVSYLKNKYIHMKNASIIGLKEADCKKISEKLNVLLANYSVFYQNTRGSHWNIKGDQFFTLHPKFEELYNSLVLKIDEIAERILTLGATPAHNYSDYLKVATIKESKEVTDGTKSVEQILSSFKVVIDLQRELLDITDEAGDEGTNSQMSDYITEQEKKFGCTILILGNKHQKH
jgi:starvation-inducible DNA-binding protein